eukprot:Seg3373.3 transcript_id=Seg3373.3/GoldUCD/mRNA.D3Y31 product="Cyclic GMP-AMP synthase" protein_id=Seg3373.3/GoldUCD/D3Y31
METRNKTWSHILLDVYKSDAALKRKGPTIELPPIVNNFIRGELIQQMKEEDELFRTIYKDNVGTGSYYQGLRVYEATEFDIDVELELYDPLFTNKDPGWVQLSCKQAVKKELEKLGATTFLGLMDSKGSIIPEKVVQWFKKVCQQALDSLIKSGAGIMEDLKLVVDSRKCGPAVTIGVTSKSGKHFDVDLVPVYCHGDATDRHKYHCVPKKGPKSNLWRITHFSAEKRLLEEPGCAKKVIKLLKLFRDRRGEKWKRMASYYLKSIVMYMISDERRISWRENHIGQRYFDALTILNERLILHYIPFYPDAKENLLRRVGKTTVEKMQKDLGTVLKEIHEHPESLRGLFAVRDDERPGAEKVVTEGRSKCEARERCGKEVLATKRTAIRESTASATRKSTADKSARESYAPRESKATKATKTRKPRTALPTASLDDTIRCDEETTTAATQSKHTMPKATIVPTVVSTRKNATGALPIQTAAIETTTPATPTRTTATTARASNARQRKIPDTAATKAVIAKTATTTRTPLEAVAAAAATKTSFALKNEKSDIAAKSILRKAATTARRLSIEATMTQASSSATIGRIPDVAATKAIALRAAATTRGPPVAATMTQASSSATIGRIPDVAATKAIALRAAATAARRLSTEATMTEASSSARTGRIPDVAAMKAIALRAAATAARRLSTEAKITQASSSARTGRIPDVAATKAIALRAAATTRGSPVAATRKIPDVPATKSIMQKTTTTEIASPSVEGGTSVKTGARKPLSTRQNNVSNNEANKATIARTTTAAKTLIALTEGVAKTTKAKPVSARKDKTPNFAVINATSTTGTTTRLQSVETEATAKMAAPWRIKIYDVAFAARTITTTTAARNKTTTTTTTAARIQ